MVILRHFTFITFGINKTNIEDTMTKEQVEKELYDLNQRFWTELTMQNFDEVELIEKKVKRCEALLRICEDEEDIARAQAISGTGPIGRCDWWQRLSKASTQEQITEVLNTPMLPDITDEELSKPAED